MKIHLQFRLQKKTKAKKYLQTKSIINISKLLLVLDSYTSLSIPYVLPKQELTLSANFEVPITFISNNINGIFFPLTYPTFKDDEIVKCNDFHFACKFNSDQFQPNSISSNPEGVFDSQTSTYTANKLNFFYRGVIFA